MTDDGPGFTVLPPGKPFTAPPARRRPRPRLVVIRRAETAPGMIGPVAAVMSDGEWMFERQPDGTWKAGHFPTETVVRSGLFSLATCQSYARSDRARNDLEKVRAHERGEHGKHARGCYLCIEAARAAEAERAA